MFRRQVTASDNLYGRHNNRRLLRSIVGSRPPIYISRPTRFPSVAGAQRPSAARHDASLGPARRCPRGSRRRNPRKLISADFGTAAAATGSDTETMPASASCIRMTTACRSTRASRASAMVRRRRRRCLRRRHAQSYRCRRHRAGKVLLNGAAGRGQTPGTGHSPRTSAPGNTIKTSQRYF